jgi:hypothetical protein
MKTIHAVSSLVVALSLASLTLAAGCNGSREVEVKGETKAAAGATVAGKVTVEFYDQPTDTTEQEKLIDKLSLDQLGAFSKKLDVAGSKVRVYALADADADGKCTAGEAWASALATINDDDTVAPVQLQLSFQPCPAAAAPAATKLPGSSRNHHRLTRAAAAAAPSSRRPGGRRGWRTSAADRPGTRRRRPRRRGTSRPRRPARSRPPHT